MIDNSNKLDKLVSKSRQHRETREQSYRARALSLYQHVCGRCGRAFDRDNLRELTVHHRDHNHDNNPADGSNWELLCIYCHDNEHQRQLEARPEPLDNAVKKSGNATYKPFSDINARLDKNK